MPMPSLNRPSRKAFAEAGHCGEHIGNPVIVDEGIVYGTNK